ncbi:unnamed protein product [Colias eurytheme]|nr:unnamed protein product [Colias eurytheme]
MTCYWFETKTVFRRDPGSYLGTTFESFGFKFYCNSNSLCLLSVSNPMASNAGAKKRAQNRYGAFEIQAVRAAPGYRELASRPCGRAPFSPC